MWKPIETAPRDGTHVLAHPVLLDVACVVSWHGAGNAGYWRLPMTDRPTPYLPTQWMPVPSPSHAIGEPVDLMLKNIEDAEEAYREMYADGMSPSEARSEEYDAACWMES